MFVDFNILNQLGSPSINSNTFANRPAAGQTGRLFVSTDTFEIYRDNGTTWDLIGGPGSSTITGTGTATQVAYFTSSQAIGSSANLFWDNTNTRLGIGTSTPGVRLDIHGTGNMLQINSTSATANALMSFQRTGTNVWRLGDQYNSGSNYFELHNTVLTNNAIEINAATNKSIFTALQTYTTGLARGNYFDYNLSVSAGGSFSSPNAITALGASLDLTLAGSATIPSGARSGLDAYNSISFTGTGTLTHNQGAQIRAYSNLTAGWAFNGSATGTITHLAGLRALFPDNTGSAVTVTNNYALLLNDQTANTGTVTYTNRWGVYQEGASDLNYFASNVLIGTTVNAGNKLEVVGTARINFASTPDGYRNLAITYPSTFATRLTIGASNFYIENDGSPETFTFVNTTGSGIFDWKSGASATQRMRLDGNGNLGLSVTPSAWSAGKSIEIGNTGNAIWSVNATQYNILHNAYFSGNYLYATSNPASYYQQASGQHAWYNAPSGTAGNAITFTQAMTLSASGNLGIGSTATSPVSKLSIGGSGYAGRAITAYANNADYAITFQQDNGSGGGLQMFSTAATWGSDPIRITDGTSTQLNLKSNGNLLIGTTTDTGEKLQVFGNAVIGGTGNPTLSIASTSGAYTGLLYINASGGGASKIIANGGANQLFLGTNNIERFTIDSNGIKTENPTTGTAAAWKLGSRVAAAVALDATQYIQVEVGGVFYKLAIVT